MYRASFAVFVTLVFAAAPSWAKEVAGVTVPDSITVDGKALRLNGAGIRRKFIVKVYVGALYLEALSTDAQAILATDQMRIVRMIFLRDVGKERLVDAFQEAFEKNSRSEAASLRGDLAKLSTVLPAEVKSGQELRVTYVPGKGTTVGVGDGPSVTIAGKIFADAMLRSWLGPDPADTHLKKEMLAGGGT